MATAVGILADLECGKATCICHKSWAKGSGLTHCPAHQDDTPSLNVGERAGGVVFKCHSGCTQDAVMAALKARGMWAEGSGSVAPKVVARRTKFEILDLAGNAVAYKHRVDFSDGSKTFSWSPPGVKPADLMYGLEQLRQRPSTAVIVEGEKTADALRAAGIMAIATVTGAASTPTVDALAAFKGRRVILWPDNDPVGLLHMQRTAAVLAEAGAAAVLWVSWPEAPAHGDAYDYLATHTAAEALTLLRGAEVYTSVAVAATDDTRPGHASLISAADLMALVIPPQRWAIEELLPEGLGILAGMPKIGKSWLALDMVISVAEGTQVLEQFQATRGEALYLALEDPHRRLQVRLKKMLGGRDLPPGITFANEWPRFGEGGEDELADYLYNHQDTRLVVIDTLAMVKAQPVRKDGNAYEEDYRAVRQLKALADLCAVGILVVTHLKKGGASLDPLEAITGSMGISAAADSILSLAKDRNTGECSLFVTGRDVWERKLSMIFDEKTAKWSAGGEPQEELKSKTRQLMRDILTASAPDHLTPAQVAKVSGQTRNAAKWLLWTMEKEGEIASYGGGTYGPLTAAAASPGVELVSAGMSETGREWLNGV